ncbi:MAG TPA: NAD-dependent epimerase/dehydratase family protein, partial [Candidatus Atribacteria bacterium]|nr:NAD-dependent epimerase/dehydratase family protein [Candidatus Atribacteria bacterium]
KEFERFKQKYKEDIRKVKILNAEELYDEYNKDGKGVLTEAKVIKFILIAEGVPEDVIYLEESSSNTLANMEESYTLIKEVTRQFPEPNKKLKIHIVTDGFHRLRALLTAIEVFKYGGPYRKNKSKIEPDWEINAEALYIPRFNKMEDDVVIKYLEHMIGKSDEPKEVLLGEIERILGYRLPREARIPFIQKEIENDWNSEVMEDLRKFLKDYKDLKRKSDSLIGEKSKASSSIFEIQSEKDRLFVVYFAFQKHEEDYWFTQAYRKFSEVLDNYTRFDQFIKNESISISHIRLVEAVHFTTDAVNRISHNTAGKHTLGYRVISIVLLNNFLYRKGMIDYREIRPDPIIDILASSPLSKFGITLVDIGGTIVLAVVVMVDRNGNLLRKEGKEVIISQKEIRTPVGLKEEFYDRIAKLIREVQRNAIKKREIKVLRIVGVGQPGKFINTEEKTGVIALGTAVNLGPDFDGIVPKEELERRLGIRVYVNNDAIAQMTFSLKELLRQRDKADLLYGKKVAYIGPGTDLGGGFGFVNEKGEIQFYTDGHIVDLKVIGYKKVGKLEIEVDGEVYSLSLPYRGDVLLAGDLLSGRSIRQIATAIDRMLIRNNREPVFLPLIDSYESLTDEEKRKIVAPENYYSPINAKLINTKILEGNRKDKKVHRAVPIPMRWGKFEGEKLGRIIKTIYRREIEKGLIVPVKERVKEILEDMQWLKEDKEKVKGTVNYIIGGTIGIKGKMTKIIIHGAKRYLKRKFPNIQFNLFSINKDTKYIGALGSFLFIDKKELSGAIGGNQYIINFPLNKEKKSARISMIGATGLLGRKIYYELSKEFSNILGTGYSRFQGEFDYLDVTSEKIVKEVIMRYSPDVVIYSAGVVNLEKVSENPEWDYQLNAYGIRLISRYFKGRFVYISSNYIFDGKNPPYGVDSIPNPVNVYGRTKLESEKQTLLNFDKFIIIRAGILYGYNNKSSINLFPKMVLEKLVKKDQIIVDNFRIYYSVLIDDVAKIILELVRNKVTGVFHINGNDAVRKYQWAVKIAKIWEYSEDYIDKYIKGKRKESPVKRPLNPRLFNSFQPTELEKGIYKGIKKIKGEINPHFPVSSSLNFQEIFNRTVKLIFRAFLEDYPERVTVVGWKFKKERFILHAEGLGIENNFNYMGVNNPEGESLKKAIEGEKKKLKKAKKDSLLRGEEWQGQREKRDPFKRPIPSFIKEGFDKRVYDIREFYIYKKSSSSALNIEEKAISNFKRKLYSVNPFNQWAVEGYKGEMKEILKSSSSSLILPYPLTKHPSQYSQYKALKVILDYFKKERITNPIRFFYQEKAKENIRIKVVKTKKEELAIGVFIKREIRKERINERVFLSLFDGAQSKLLLRRLLRLLKQTISLSLFFTSLFRKNNYTAEDKYNTQDTNCNSPESRKLFKKVTCQPNYKDSLAQICYCLGNELYFLFIHYFHSSQLYYRLKTLSRSLFSTIFDFFLTFIKKSIKISTIKYEETLEAVEGYKGEMKEILKSSFSSLILSFGKVSEENEEIENLIREEYSQINKALEELRITSSSIYSKEIIKQLLDRIRRSYDFRSKNANRELRERVFEYFANLKHILSQYLTKFLNTFRKLYTLLLKSKGLINGPPGLLRIISLSVLLSFLINLFSISSFSQPSISGNFFNYFSNQTNSHRLIGEAKYVPGELIIKIKGNVLKSIGKNKFVALAGTQLEYLNKKYKVKEIIKMFPSAVPLPSSLVNVYIIRFERKDYDMEKIAKEYESLESVEYAHPNYTGKFDYLPNDTYWDELWGLHKIQVSGAWE